MEGLHTCWLLWGNALLLACLACMPACCYPFLALPCLQFPSHGGDCCAAWHSPLPRMHRHIAHA